MLNNDKLLGKLTYRVNKPQGDKRKSCKTKKGENKKEKLKMIWICGKVPMRFDESRWVFPETHMEDSGLEDERTAASK